MLARENAEQVLADRAMNGVEEAVFYHGEEVARRRCYDTRLLLAHLARLDRRADTTFGAVLAARFDEVVAMVAGEMPGSELFALHEYDGPDPEAPRMPMERAGDDAGAGAGGGAVGGVVDDEAGADARDGLPPIETKSLSLLDTVNSVNFAAGRWRCAHGRCRLPRGTGTGNTGDESDGNSIRNRGAFHRAMGTGRRLYRSGEPLFSR